MALWRGIGARKDATRGTSPIEVRKTVAALFARPGILPGGASPLLTGDATWAYNVGVANFVTSRGASDGDQLYGNDSVALIGATGVGSTVPIAPGAGLSRIDIIWTRHPTNLENADTSSDPLFGVASGVAASSSPVAPVIPAGALELGRNLMTSAATSTLSAGNTITQSALYTALWGAPVQVRTQAERDAYGALVGLVDGLRVYRLDMHSVETYNGTTWGLSHRAVSAELTTNSAGFYSPAVGILSAPSITGDGVKKFKITANYSSVSSTGANDVFNITIEDITTSTVLTGRYTPMPATAGSVPGACITTVDVPAAGAHVYRLAGVRTGGTGIGTINAAPTYPIDIIVEQIA
jgi:hypothetical protein